MRRAVIALLLISLSALGLLARFAGENRDLGQNLLDLQDQNPHLMALGLESRLKALIAQTERLGNVQGTARSTVHKSLDDLWEALGKVEQPTAHDAFMRVFGGPATLKGLSTLLTSVDADIRMLQPLDRTGTARIIDQLDGFVPPMHSLVTDAHTQISAEISQIIQSQARNTSWSFAMLAAAVLSQLVMVVLALRQMLPDMTIQQQAFAMRNRMSHQRLRGLSGLQTEASEKPEADGVARMREAIAEVFQRHRIDPEHPAPAPEDTDVLLQRMMRTAPPAPVRRPEPALHRRQIALLPLLDGLMAEIGPSLSAQGLAAAVYVDPKVPSGLNMDPEALKTVLRQLLGNAYKFTPCGGVVLSADVVQDGLQRQLRLTVLDTGIGLSPRDRELIFHDQVQVDPSRAAVPVPFDPEQKGHGFGLSDARALVRRLGGEIRAYGQPALGSRFIVTLPIIDADAPVASSLELLGRAYLVVDHSPVRGEVLADQLRAMGADVTLADHEMAALDAINAADTMMPGYDLAIVVADRHTGKSFALAERLRHGRNAPRRVALAQMVGETADPLAREVADHVLSLPVGIEDLLDVVRLRVIDPVDAEAAPVARLGDFLQPPPETARVEDNRPRAALYEHNPADRANTASQLRGIGWLVEDAGSPADLLERSRHPLEAILIGIGTEEAEQRQALMTVQALRQRAVALPVIGLVEREISELHRDFLLAAGFDALVDKPASNRTLMKALMARSQRQAETEAGSASVNAIDAVALQV